MAFGSGEQKQAIQGVSTGANSSDSLNCGVPDGPKNTPWTAARTAPARHTGGQGPGVRPSQGPQVPPGQGGSVPREGQGEFLTVREAAGLLKVSRATVYRLVADGKVRAVRVSHAIRILLPDAPGVSKGYTQDCGSGG